MDLDEVAPRRRAGVGAGVIARLAEADCFAALGLTRRAALWAAKAISGDAPLPLFAQDLDGEVVAEPHIVFAQMSEGEAVVEELRKAKNLAIDEKGAVTYRI